jgi:hypothetical protein
LICWFASCNFLKAGEDEALHAQHANIQDDEKRSSGIPFEIIRVRSQNHADGLSPWIFVQNDP